MYNTRDAMINNAQIPSNNLRVSIYISIEDDALLRILLDEDTITIGGALGTYVVWLVHLIDVVPTMGGKTGQPAPPRLWPAKIWAGPTQPLLLKGLKMRAQLIFGKASKPAG
ncbi:hypothetical protein Lal_00030175 [Lupinus albus]|nr:hypothetical protein Lal_00030175 [Lupinus albus]